MTKNTIANQQNPEGSFDLASTAEENQMYIQAGLRLLNDYISTANSSDEEHLLLGMRAILENVSDSNKKLTKKLYESSRSARQQSLASHE